MKKTKTFSLLAGSLIALALISAKSRADTAEANWGDLGYTHPESATQTEALTAQETRAAEQEKGVDNDEIAATISNSQMQEQQVKPAEKEKSVSNLSSVQNTYGVETEETRAISFYVAPFAGITSLLGADSVNSSSQYLVGGSLGVLLSDRFLIEGSFTHAETNVASIPGFGTTGFVTGGNMILKQNVISGGGKFFILGRESRIRPFIGGGVAYSRGSLNYETALAAQTVGTGALNDLSINQFEGFGSLGAEVGITRSIVASAMFQIDGNLSSDVNSSSGADTARFNAGSSVSRTASYVIAGGVGIYF